MSRCPATTMGPLGNKMNDCPYISRSDIADPYCHWTEDKRAASHPFFVARKVIYVFFCVLMATLAIVGLLQRSTHSIPYYGIIMRSAMTCMGIILVFSFFFLNRIPTIRCSACGSEMKSIQVDPPPGTPYDMQGQYGRIYCRVQGEGDNHRHWVRLVQELRICATCNRYVVVQKAAHIVIGPSKQNVLEYEDRFNAARHAIEGKKFRLKKQPGGAPNHR